jgi:ArsR family transcriptional regulator
MPLPLGDLALEPAAELFGLLSAPTRLRIVCALMDGESSVSELLERIDVSQPNISQHLGMLYRAGIVGRRRRGVQVLYRVTHDGVVGLCQALLQPQAPASRQSRSAIG